MNKILYAIQTLHIRFMESPTERAANHIKDFIARSYDDLDRNTLSVLADYYSAIHAASGLSPTSMAHLQTAAAEIFEVAA